MSNNRQTRKSGGFSNSDTIWNFGLCKALIKEFNIQKDDGALRSHLECLKALARAAGVSADDLYNKMTPYEFIVKKLGHTPKSHLRLAQKLSRGMQGILLRDEDKWRMAADFRDEQIKEGKTWGEPYLFLRPLPDTKAKTKAKSKSKSRSRSKSKSSQRSANSTGSRNRRESFF